MTTLVNSYSTLAEAKTDIGIAVSDGISDEVFLVGLNAASRQIDKYCSRRFWQDATVATRTYFADDNYTTVTDDISTLTGLIVKVDTGGDGTYTTTLTIATDFIMLPPNALLEVPVRPYESIRAVDGEFVQSNRPGVQVTAKFGWPAVPDDVHKAYIIQAVQLAKVSSAPFGVASFGDAGFMMLRSQMNPQAAALLEGYVRRVQVMNG